MFRLIAAASIRIRFFLRCYMPTNILADAIRTRRGHKWGPAAMLLAGPYFLLAVWFVHLIDTGGPGWLHLLVLLAIWNGFKMLWLGPLGIAWLLRARLAERGNRRQHAPAPEHAQTSDADLAGVA
ncbi:MULTISPECIES: hypothetical protein [Micrococcales]|jgi:hypothetical protein|uniref:Sulfate permease n=2 Tax=Micrococcales TaxID=85006 RepID=A0A1W2BPW6_9MICO|nr:MULTISPECIES: hypothetical protein [Micrococcales]MCL6422255.1 sulfate permease [Brachybacterium equifaecis]OLT38352.1 hypothetical protein BJF82_08770 [Kytococcus sp. CUA-901]RYI20583.1 sulfate permease [Dermacoccus sp. 147Ba]SMC74774.1 hypothetical protein SAMN06296429_108210 [Janibacter indicus]